MTLDEREVWRRQANSAVRIAAGEVLWKKGLQDQAITEFLWAYNQEHQFGPDALHVRQNLEKAAAELRAAIRVDPKNSMLFYLLGISLFADSHNEGPRSEQAVERRGAFRKAVELDPKNAEAHYYFGSCLKDQDQAGAEREFRAAIKLKPDHRWAHLELSGLLRGEQAIDVLRDAVRMNPTDSFLCLKLGDTLRSWDGKTSNS